METRHNGGDYNSCAPFYLFIYLLTDFFCFAFFYCSCSNYPLTVPNLISSESETLCQNHSAHYIIPQHTHTHTEMANSCSRGQQARQQNHIPSNSVSDASCHSPRSEEADISAVFIGISPGWHFKTKI